MLYCASAICLRDAFVLPCLFFGCGGVCVGVCPYELQWRRPILRGSSGDVLSGDVLVRLCLAIGMELSVTPMIAFGFRAGPLVVGAGVLFCVVCLGASWACYCRLLSGLLLFVDDSGASSSSLLRLASRRPMSVQWSRCVVVCPWRWFLRLLPMFGAPCQCSCGAGSGSGVRVWRRQPEQSSSMKEKTQMDFDVIFLFFGFFGVTWGCIMVSV